MKRLKDALSNFTREHERALGCLLANSVILIIPFTALGMTLSDGTDDDDVNNYDYIYAAGNATSDNSTTTTSFKYETGALGTLIQSRLELRPTSYGVWVE